MEKARQPMLWTHVITPPESLVVMVPVVMVPGAARVQPTKRVWSLVRFALGFRFAVARGITCRQRL